MAAVEPKPLSSFALVAALLVFCASRASAGAWMASSFAEKPSLYIFGASMVDGGENAVAMPARSRAERSPYGMDYFSKPAGRWSNGRTFMDLISQEIGYGLIFPYLRAIGSNFTYGVNFASSGSTAQNSSASGDDSGGLFSLLVQVEQFRDFQAAVESTAQGDVSLKEHFASSIYFIETAHNDYLSVAFVSEDFDLDVTVQATVYAMKQALEALYRSGARTFIVMNVTPLGCTPAILSNALRTENRDEYGCKADYNDMVSLHNANVSAMLEGLREQYPDGTWVLFDAYTLFSDAYHNPSNYGVQYPFQACCGAGGEYNFMEDVPCGGGSQLVNGSYIEATRCSDPSLYIIWDAIHPVEPFSQYIAQAVLSGSHLYPTFNITEKIQSMASLGAMPY